MNDTIIGVIILLITLGIHYFTNPRNAKLAMIVGFLMTLAVIVLRPVGNETIGYIMGLLLAYVVIGVEEGKLKTYPHMGKYLFLALTLIFLGTIFNGSLPLVWYLQILMYVAVIFIFVVIVRRTKK